MVSTATKTVLNVKIDAKLKKEAQKLASSLGLPISTVVSNLLRKFTDERRITFEEPLMPNKKTRALIDEARRDYKAGKIKTFSSMEEFVNDLMS